jgi:hypothetical protein
MTDKTDLAKEIFAFLDAHAKTAATWDARRDPEEEKFNGPDASLLFNAAELLAHDTLPRKVYSVWGSGCYYPIHNKTAETKHNDLVSRVNKLVKK